MNQTGTHLVRRIVCPHNPTLCSGTGPGCPPSTAAWRSSSCPYRASSASSFRSVAATLTFNLQPRLAYLHVSSWMHFSSANVISRNNGQLSLGQTIYHFYCWELAALWIPLHAFLLLTLLGTARFYEATFANTKSQVTSTASFPNVTVRDHNWK